MATGKTTAAAGVHRHQLRLLEQSQRIEQHAEKLTPVLQQLQDDPAVERIHLVTHSMGCIIGRWILSRQRFEKIDRWVMLAPPNRGSHAADSIGRFFQWLLIPIDQLSESPDSFVNRIPDFRKTNAVNFSIVEASKDLVIRSASLPLEGMSDYAVIPCHHGPMPFNRQVGQYVERFLTAD